MYKKNDYIMVIHPNYPELNGLAKIADNVVTKIVNIEFCDDKSQFLAHLEFIRPATQEEIDKFLSE